MEFEYQEDKEFEVLEDVKVTEVYDLVVYNDDFNTFDHVIKTLINICKHTPEQAEQCTILIHYKGKCAVRTGPINLLVPMKDGILDAGIDAKIQ